MAAFGSCASPAGGQSTEARIVRFSSSSAVCGAAGSPPASAPGTSWYTMSSFAEPTKLFAYRTSARVPGGPQSVMFDLAPMMAAGGLASASAP